MSDAPTGREFGQLEGRVAAQGERLAAIEKRLAEIEDKMDSGFGEINKRLDPLSNLAERSRGAYGAMALMLSGAGALIMIAWKAFTQFFGGPK